MAHEIPKDLLGDPKKVEFVVVQSDGRFPAALSGKVDFGLCSTTIYPDRAVRIAFTRPYLDTGNSLIARKDAKIKTIQDELRPRCRRPGGVHGRGGHCRGGRAGGNVRAASHRPCAPVPETL